MSNHFKLYGRVDNKASIFKPFPGAGDESVFGFNYMTRKISVPSHLLTELTSTTSAAVDELLILAEINNDCDSVLAWAELIFDTTLSTSKTESLKLENKRVAEKIKNNIHGVKKYITTPENLIIPKTTWQLMLSGLEFGIYPMLLGPKGNGKTTTAYETANALGYKFFKLDCGTLFKPKTTLIGQTQASSGNTFLVKSEFLTHYTSNEKTLIFLDEISRIPSQASNYMMTILDANNPHVYVDEEAKTYEKGKDVIFMAAGNFGPEYTDARVLDGALEDRFLKYYLEYLDEENELQLIKKKLSIHPEGKKISEDSLRKLIQIAARVREGVKNQDLMTNISTRKLIQFSYFLIHGFTSMEVVSHLMRNLFKHSESELEYFDNIISVV